MSLDYHSPFRRHSISEPMPEGYVGELLWLDHGYSDKGGLMGTLWYMAKDGCWHKVEGAGLAPYGEMVRTFRDVQRMGYDPITNEPL